MIRCLVLAAFSLFGLTAFAYPFPTECLDISGKYRSPYDTAGSDVVTTVIISQVKCESLIIGGFQVAQGSHYQVYGPQTLSLHGHPAPKPDKDCRPDAFPGACAFYLASHDFILKSVENAIVEDPVHGFCVYFSSHLYKDADGNLLEKPIAAKCDGQYVPALTPIVWPVAR